MSPAAVTRERCLHHPDREAAARCPECSQFFCRECITEHEDRVICADCLRKLAVTRAGPRARLGMLAGAAWCVFSVFAAWIFYYEMGRILVLIPASFHDGTLWHSDSP